MSTITALITSARYDLRDIGKTNYTNAELLDYANRALFQLDNALSSTGSDWVFTDEAYTITGITTSSPARCILVRSLWIDTSELIKQTPAELHRLSKYISTSYQPNFFAQEGSTIAVECVPDVDYDATIQYDKRSAILVLDDDMPYSDEFNGMIREMVIVLAHKRQEGETISDSEIYNFFKNSAFGNVIARNHVNRRNGLDF